MRRKKRHKKPLYAVIAVLGLVMLFTPANTNKLAVTITLLVSLCIGLVVVLLNHVKLPQLTKPAWFSMKVTRQKGQPQHPNVETLLWRQINFQITDKLQSAYPGATWDYLTSPDINQLLDCHPIRIRTNQTGDYNFCEVHMNPYGSLSLVMMTVEALTPARKKAGNGESPKIDPESWYALIGRPLLTEVIGELQARGHQKLFINEQGEIFIQNNDAQEIKGIFDQFPSKSYWPALTDILIRDELKATETDHNLELSWV